MVHQESKKSMLKVWDINDSAESSKKAGFNCSYSHKSLLDFSEASAQFAPNEILTHKSYILKFTLYYQVGSFFIVFFMFKILVISTEESSNYFVFCNSNI